MVQGETGSSIGAGHSDWGIHYPCEIRNIEHCEGWWLSGWIGVQSIVQLKPGANSH